VLKEHLFADGLGEGVGVGIPALLQQRLRPELKHVRALTKPGEGVGVGIPALLQQRLRSELKHVRALTKPDAMRKSFCFNSASSDLAGMSAGLIEASRSLRPHTLVA
jgi:hypothetical protein